MDKFLQEVANPYFWYATFGVGIAVNLLSSLITKLAPRFGLSLVFWWSVRTKRATENQSQREKKFWAKVAVVASQPALISSFLVRAYALYICGATICVLGVWGLFLAVSIDVVLFYGAKYSWSWWWGMFNGYVQAILILTIAVQVLKLANQRYLISTIAEERLMELGLEKLTAEVSREHPRAP